MNEREALKLALEALEKLWNIIDDIDTYGDMAKADEKLYRSLVERRQRTRFEETGISTDGYTLNGGAITAIKEALEKPEPEQEPVAYAAMINGEIAWDSDYPFSNEPFSCFDDEQSVPLYTAPPKREWVGLTKEEVDSWELPDSPTVFEFAQFIEDKLRDKNNG